MKDLLKYRVWDPIRKELAPVWELIFETIQVGNHLAIKAMFKNGGLAYANPGSILMMETGIKDNNSKMIFEGDLLDCIFQHPRTGFMEKLRGRIIWNPQPTYGDYGFVIIDQDNGIHPFRSIDSMVVVGNIHEGVRKQSDAV